LSFPPEVASEEKLVRDAQFKTIFRVYLTMLRLKKASVRDVQKAMGFATPSQARYHLRRLNDYGLVIADEMGNYRVVSKRFGMLRFYIKTERWILPLSLFFAGFFAVLTATLYFRTGYLELLILGALITVKELFDTYTFFKAL
jgi:DNA-binding transcriptional ArsR family regulator